MPPDAARPILDRQATYVTHCSMQPPSGWLLNVQNQVLRASHKTPDSGVDALEPFCQGLWRRAIQPRCICAAMRRASDTPRASSLRRRAADRCRPRCRHHLHARLHARLHAGRDGVLAADGVVGGQRQEVGALRRRRHLRKQVRRRAPVAAVKALRAHLRGAARWVDHGFG